MKAFTGYLKLISIVVCVILTTLLIWLSPYLFNLDDDAFFASTNVQWLLTIILVLATTFIAYMIYVVQPLKKANAPGENQATLKKNLKQQRLLFKKHAHEVFSHLKIAFQIWGHKKQRYLRKLPWYVVLGGTNSGKSTLLANSGLDFSPTETLGPDPLQTGNSHRDFIWRFSKDAVILDIQNNRSIENTDNLPAANWGINLHDPFWAGILRLIKRYRRQQPLNGALITLSLPDLLLQSDKNRQTQQQALKSVLQTIHQELKIQTPIYLLLTKSDLIAGFTEYFADLAKEDQEQVWGIAFSAQTASNPQQTQEYFKQAFDQLIIRLQERLLLRLETEQDLTKRMLISYFPQQIQLCKNLLNDFILQDEKAQIRGIYFTSSLQNGESYDLLLSAIAKKYNLNAPAPNQQAPHEKAYFIQNLFHEVILPDAHQVSNSPYLQRIKTYGYRTSWATAIFCLLFGTIGLSTSYARNKTNLELIERYLPDYQQAASQLATSDKSLTATLPLLNVLKNIREIYVKAPSKWLLYIEIYQPLKIDNTIDDIWQRTLSSYFMPRVAYHLETMLNKYQNNPEVLYQTLKAYLVFSPADNTDPDWLKTPIAYDVATTLSNQTEEQFQINNYLAAALAYPVDTLPLNQKIIDKARERLRKVMPVEFAYYELKQEAADAQDQLNLIDKLGPDFANTFTLFNSKIPSLYTASGYKDLRGKKSDLLIKHTAEIYWILGLDKTTDGDDLITTMTPALWRHYNDDYINSWNNLLANTQVSPFTHLTEAIQTLTLLTTPRSPLMKLLLTIKENTFLVRGKNLRIAQYYSPLNKITGLSSKPGTQYNAIIKNLMALRDYLTTLNNAPNTTQMEFQEASAYLQNKAPNNPIAILKKQAQQMPAPLNRWLNEIADNSFNLLLQGAHQVINTAWQNNVMPAYQANIQGRFPFNSQSDTYADITNFGDFFGGNGIFMQFLQTYLAPFIDTAHSPWRQLHVGNYSLGIADNTMMQLEKVTLIHNMYFQTNSPLPLVQFTIKPRILDPQASSIYVQLANQNLTYQHGPQQPFNWQWPMLSNSQQVNISFSDFQGQNFSRTFDGPWAWYKLLSTTQLQTSGIPGHYIWTITQDKHQASFDLWTTNNIPVFNLQILENLNLPPNI